MSEVVNTEGMQPGCIHRIALQNFVTYKEMVVYPGPSLNMFVGPDGSVKSTIVCGIILGLCGNPNSTGPEKKISEYVRSGCDQAKIEIELYRKTGERNVIITRSFNLKCVSTWSIDHKTVAEKQVQQLIQSLNIQVNNFCQLPLQDQVQDFSKTDPPQLLCSALAAVGEVVEKLEEFVIQKMQREPGAEQKSNQQMLQEQLRLNERLKVEIDVMQQRKKIEKNIETWEKKQLEYQELQEKLIGCTNNEKQSEKLSRMRPLVVAIAQARKYMVTLKMKILASSREVNTLKDKVKENLVTIMTHQQCIGDLQSSFQDMCEHYLNSDRELQLQYATKENNDAGRKTQGIGNAVQLTTEILMLKKTLDDTVTRLENITRTKVQKQYDLEKDLLPQIEFCQYWINQLGNVSRYRLQKLKQENEEWARAVTWYRENAHKVFREVSCEPMALTIKFIDPKYARYLENTVSKRDLLSFTFESTRDMKLFLHTIRSKLGLKAVKAVCSPKTEVLQLHKPPEPLNKIRNLGFDNYLVNTFTAPAPIIRYLCHKYKIHRIPIGNELTYNNSDKVPNVISCFYSENHKFTVDKTAGSGAKSTVTSEVPPAKILADCVDDEMNNLKNQLAHYQRKADSHRQEFEEMDRELTILLRKMRELDDRRRVIMQITQEMKVAEKTDLFKSKIAKEKPEPAIDMVKEHSQMLRKQKELVLKQSNLHGTVIELMKALNRQVYSRELLKVELSLNIDANMSREAELRELQLNTEQ